MTTTFHMIILFVYELFLTHDDVVSFLFLVDLL